MDNLTESQQALVLEFADMQAFQLSHLLAGTIRAVNPVYCGSAAKGAWTPLVECVPEIEDKISRQLSTMVSRAQIEDVMVILEQTLRILGE